jgi:hypothetical protein
MTIPNMKRARYSRYASARASSPSVDGAFLNGSNNEVQENFPELKIDDGDQ